METTATTFERRVRVIPATKAPETLRKAQDDKMRVAAYCRVSTDSEEQLNSYEAQKSYYTQKIQDSPDWEMAGIYADEGITGTSLKKRTEFKKMITACKRGHIDLIITKSLSRFARNTVDCLETVRLLKANGIGVYFEKENINTLTESSEFLITLFSGFAQAESESLSKNVAWGKAKSAEAGKVTFQYKKMLGYRKGADGQPEIVPEEAEVIKRIYHRYLDGCTLGQIKRELDEDDVPTAQGVDSWSPAIIHNILTNEKYIGDALLQKTYVTDCISKKVKKNQGERAMYYVENNHPAIISREVFDQVRNEMTRRSSKRKVLQKSGKTELGKYSGKYALTELLVCGECGSPYKRVTWARNGKKRIVWRCVSRLEFGTKYCHNSPTLDESKLHSAILAAMNEFAAIRQEVCPDVLTMAEEAKQALSQAGAKLLELKKHLEAVSREQSDLLDRLLENMGDAELNAKMKALTDEKESLKAQILDTQQMEVSLEEQAARHQQMWDSIMECSAGYTEFDDELVRQIIQKITVEDEETIRIHFRDSEMVMEQEL
ncbi:recombinase family protein [Agathobaculum butyriciproducens]|uniref:recombinase family protein n=1 Tax=Agathobaculum butyriciproducens TaxID=1628085 RepID=UPI003AB3F6FB